MDASIVAERNAQARDEAMAELRSLLAFIDGERDRTLMEWERAKAEHGEDAWADHETWRMDAMTSLWEATDDLAKEIAEDNAMWARGRNPVYEGIHTLVTRALSGNFGESDCADFEIAMMKLSGLLCQSRWASGGTGEEDGLASRFERITGRMEPVASIARDLLGPYDEYLDETIALPRGNYVVTDPCYLLRDGEGYGELAESLPVFKMRGTLYGDWSCTMFRTESAEPDGNPVPVGQFCADAGLVCVADWDGAVRHNPDVASWPDGRPWTMTVLRGFEGVATFRVTEEELGPDGDGRPRYDRWLEVILEGTDADGNPVRYEGRQTGL